MFSASELSSYENADGVVRFVPKEIRDVLKKNPKM